MLGRTNFFLVFGTVLVIWVFIAIGAVGAVVSLEREHTRGWVKAALAAGYVVVGLAPLGLAVYFGQSDRGLGGLQEVGRILLLIPVLSLILAGWPLVLISDWSRPAKVGACALLAVVSIGGRTLLGWYDL